MGSDVFTVPVDTWVESEVCIKSAALESDTDLFVSVFAAALFEEAVASSTRVPLSVSEPVSVDEVATQSLLTLFF